MLYNESPVYYCSVVTSALSYGSVCWGAVSGSVWSPRLLRLLRIFELRCVFAELPYCLFQGEWANSPHELFRWLKLQIWVSLKRALKNVGLTGKSLGKVERVFVNWGLDSVSPFDFSLGMNERPGMLPVAILLVTLLEKANDIIKDMVFAW